MFFNLLKVFKVYLQKDRRALKMIEILDKNSRKAFVHNLYTKLEIFTE